MPTATIKVAYVNPPKEGAKSGSIKDTDGAYWGALPPILNQVAKGSTLDIEYTEKTAQSGKVFRDIKRIIPRSQPAQSAPQPGNGAQPKSAYTTGANDRAIFVTGVVGRALGSGQFGVADIVTLTLTADQAFDALEAKRAGRSLPTNASRIAQARRGEPPPPESEDEYGPLQ